MIETLLQIGITGIFYRMILAGDIGGTNTRLALFDDQLKLVGKPLKFLTGKGADLEANAAKLLKKHRMTVQRACLAVAGPVVDGCVKMTNVPRSLDTKDLSKSLKIGRVSLINDLVANASGIELLSQKELKTLLPGQKHQGNRAVVSPGTGLGIGALVWDNQFHRPIPTEGGHAYFSPSDELEAEMWLYLNETFETVTWEHFLSGKGIENIFNFFVEIGGDVNPTVAKKIAKAKPGTRAAIISEAAQKNICESSSATLEMFVRLLAIQCQNVAVQYFAIGGVFIGGGIPPRIQWAFKTREFKKVFLHHDTMGHLMPSIPVKLILNPDTALEGAALYGTRFG